MAESRIPQEGDRVRMLAGGSNEFHNIVGKEGVVKKVKDYVLQVEIEGETHRINSGNIFYPLRSQVEVIGDGS